MPTGFAWEPSNCREGELMTTPSSHSSSKLRSVTAALFLLLLFLAVFLPTGSLFGVNVKVIALALFCAAFVFYLIADGAILSRSDVVFLLLVAGALCFWSLVGILRSGTDSLQTFSELRMIASVIFIAWVGILFIRKGVVRPERLITVVIYALVATGCLKFALLAGMVIYGANPIESIESIFGVGSVLSAFTQRWFRIEFAADILAPFGLFALMAPSVSGVNFGRISRIALSVLLLASVIMAYSRYTWFAFVCAVLGAAVIEKTWRTVAGTTIACVLLLAVLYGDVFSDVLVERFQSEGVAISDEGRVHQFAALVEEIEHRPVLGKGMGASAIGHMSSIENPYSYELQWLAFVMQFGILGSIGILLLIAESARDLILAKHPAKLYVGLVFLVWLSSAWTNPAVISSFAGGAFALFMAMFHRLRFSDDAAVFHRQRYARI